MTARWAPSASPWASGPCSGPPPSVSRTPCSGPPVRSSALSQAFSCLGRASTIAAYGVPWFTASRRTSYGQVRANSPRLTARKTHSGCQGGTIPGVSTGTQVRRVAPSRIVGSGAVQPGMSACSRATSTYSRVRASTSTTASPPPPRPAPLPPATAADSARSIPVGGAAATAVPLPVTAPFPVVTEPILRNGVRRPGGGRGGERRAEKPHPVRGGRRSRRPADRVRTGRWPDPRNRRSGSLAEDPEIRPSWSPRRSGRPRRSGPAPSGPSSGRSSPWPRRAP